LRTPLHDAHKALGARLVDFAGWQMPVQYTGIIEEHLHTRQAASVFDVCHMSEFRVTGRGAVDALREALACRLDGLSVGQCRYGFLLKENGGIIDDLICYRTARDEFMVVANAGRRKVDGQTIAERLPDDVVFEDVSDGTGKVDVQGPQSLDALLEIAGEEVGTLHFFRSCRTRVAGVDALVSRTGYTGELGYEIYVDTEDVETVWSALNELRQVRPAGLGARDTLRLEVGYPLYGHELTEDVTPLEAGYGWALPLDARFVGAEAMAMMRSTGGIERALVGIEFDGRRAAREGDAVLVDGEKVGEVTSGAFGPSVGHAVALAYVAPEHDRVDRPVQAEVRGKRIDGRIARPPFYTEGSARKEL
jgi:aminomethyltransferase